MNTILLGGGALPWSHARRLNQEERREERRVDNAVYNARCEAAWWPARKLRWKAYLHVLEAWL